MDELVQKINEELGKLGLPQGMKAVASIGKCTCGRQAIKITINQGEVTQEFIAMHEPFEDETAEFFSGLNVITVLSNFYNPPPLH